MSLLGFFSQNPPVIAPFLAVIAAILGGVLQDVFFDRILQQFLPGQIYAMTAVLGTIVYMLLWSQDLGTRLGFIAFIAVNFLTRMVEVKFNITSFLICAISDFIHLRRLCKNTRLTMS